MLGHVFHQFRKNKFLIILGRVYMREACLQFWTSVVGPLCLGLTFLTLIAEGNQPTTND